MESRINKTNMSNPTKEFVNISEYSRHRGVSDPAVHKAIKEGKIVEGVVTIKGKRLIDWKKADEEWDRHRNPARPRETRADKAAKAAGQELSKASEGGASYADIKRMKELQLVKKLDLENKKKEGTLVLKDAVYRAFYDYGQEMRIRLEAIPDQVIDNVLASNNRHDARNILVEAIEEALTMLSSPPKIK